MSVRGFAVASVSLNGSPLTPGAAAVLETPESVVTFVLTKQTGEVTGTVRDSNQDPVADSVVVIMPANLIVGTDRMGLPPGMSDEVVSDAHGRFAIEGLAPGKYKIWARKAGERRGPMNAAFIRAQMLSALSVTVEASQTANLDVQVLH
jgi:hypothetical protein